jgi:hypothetical protein
MSHKKLEKWLKQSNKCSSNIYEDPGYSGFYKSYYGNYVYKSFYPEDDIDIKISPVYIEDIYTENTDELQQFIDYIPQDIPSDIINNITIGTYGTEKQNIIDKLERKCLLIPPGSNQSNVNFIYKLLLDNMINVDNFSIPFISHNINEQYKGTLKNSYMNIDKMELYNFVYNNSIKQ